MEFTRALNTLAKVSLSYPKNKKTSLNVLAAAAAGGNFVATARLKIKTIN